MFSLDGYQPVDLSPRLKARVYRVDGTLEEGNTDPYGKPWVMKEGRFPGDNSLFTLYAAPVGGDEAWHQERMTSHHGAHVQGGAGHISHWAGVPDDMKGIWEMPLSTFMGEAAVCNLEDLTPEAMTAPGQYPKGEGYYMQGNEGDIRGQEIRPEHLPNIQVGDIVLMTSPFEGLEQPWLSKETCEWLINDRRIRMLGIGVPGIEWQYDPKIAAPDNSPIRRLLLGANVPIAHPLANIETLTKDRVFYVGLPLNFPKMEASFIRAVAFEEV
jgi:kynurenine formamidase